MTQDEIDAALARMTPRQMQAALKAIAASKRPDSPFARVAAAMSTPEYRTAVAANRILAAAALACGEAGDFSPQFAGPRQDAVEMPNAAFAAAVIAAGKKRRGEV